MNRRGSQLPWGASSRPSLYGGPRRSSGAGRYVILGAILVAVAVVAWFVIARVCGGTTCIKDYCPSDRSIEAPEG